MKQKLLGSIAVSMVAVIFLSMLAILPVAHAVTTIYMTPNANPAITPAINAKFNITIWCSGYGAPPVFGWQVIIKYNGVAAGINATRAWVGSALGAPLSTQYIFVGRGEFAPPPAFIPQAQVQIGSTLLASPGEVPPPEPALLGIIEFEILAAPNKYETLTTPLSFGIYGPDTYLLDDAPAVIPGVAVIDGSYTWAWVPPTTNPRMAVSLVNPNPADTNIVGGENDVPPDPHAMLFKEFGLWNGTQFDAKILIENLEIGWALHNATFVVTYNDLLTTLKNIAIAPAWAGPNVVTNPTPGVINAFVQGHAAPSGSVLVLTLTFEIQNQGSSPPRAPGAFNTSIIDISGVFLFDTVGPVPTTPEHDATVTVKCKQALPSPRMEVVPGDIVLGPDLVIGDQFGKEFSVDLNIALLHQAWLVIGAQLRLGYDGSLVEVVSIEEGPYMGQFPNNGPPYTFFLGYDLPDDPVYGDHVLIGDLILPNATGYWSNFAGDIPETGPLGSGTIATVTFRAIKQSFVDTYNMPLAWLEVLLIGGPDGLTEVPSGSNVPGMVHILPISTVGRRIDVWMQYPSPYGGQGIDQPADLVVPQQIILLTAKVTYNWWPVAQKKVTFNVYDNQGNPVAVLEGITGDDGHAYASYRMPWPNVNPENLFGVWTVIASVSVADVTITDHLMFHYDYLVVISSVTTNKLEYAHLEAVVVSVQYKTHAIQMYNVVMTATIQDNLLVPVGLAVLSKTVGGSIFSVYKNYASSVTIIIPYWAYAGAATVRVNFLDKLPSDMTHVAVTPEETVGIYILPV